jgi:hypothetical protein
MSDKPEVPAVKVQEIEGVVDESHPALAVGRRLGVGKARQSDLVDAAELAIEIGGLRPHIRQRRDCAWIFAGPVEAGPG